MEAKAGGNVSNIWSKIRVYPSVSVSFAPMRELFATRGGK